MWVSSRGSSVITSGCSTSTGPWSQPFWLHWEGAQGRRRHAQDYFARRADGSGLVVDVRADDRIEDSDAEAFKVTALACSFLGWEFRRVGVVDPVLNSERSIASIGSCADTHPSSLFSPTNPASRPPPWTATQAAIPLHWRHRLLILQTINHHRGLGTDRDAYTRAAKFPDAIALVPQILNARENEQIQWHNHLIPTILSRKFTEESYFVHVIFFGSVLSS